MKNNAINIGMDNKCFEIQQKNGARKFKNTTIRFLHLQDYKAGIPNYFLLFLKVRLQFSLKIALFGVL